MAADTALDLFLSMFPQGLRPALRICRAYGAQTIPHIIFAWGANKIIAARQPIRRILSGRRLPVNKLRRILSGQSLAN